MDEKDILLRVKDLEVVYKTDAETVHAVNGVNFTVRRGKTLGLVGETGAGKTTIARSILRILPDPPAIVRGGQIVYDGTDLLGITEKEMRKIRGKKIAMIFQDPMTALNPLMTVGAQIAEVLQTHDKLRAGDASVKATELLELVGIPAERYHEYPHQFSGGMKQRVVIAMALACSPQLLIADEPTTALDVTIQAQVLELMGELREKFDTSMVLITHDLGVIAQNCDDVAIIYAGEIVESGTAEDVFDYPTHPYTKGLFNALPNMVKSGERLRPISGLTPNPANLPAGCKFHPRCPLADADCAKLVPEAVALSATHFCSCLKMEKGRA